MPAYDICCNGFVRCRGIAMVKEYFRGLLVQIHQEERSLAVDEVFNVDEVFCQRQPHIPGALLLTLVFLFEILSELKVVGHGE